MNGWNDWNGLRYFNELHALSDDVCSSVFDQKMNVIGCHNVIEHTKSEALRFEKPVKITAPVVCELD